MTNKDIEDKIDEILRNRIKVIGDNEHTYFGTPQDVINELTALISQVENEARGCVDCKKLRCENCERLWQT